MARAAELKAIGNTERLAQERHSVIRQLPWFARTISPVAAEDAAPAGQVSNHRYTKRNKKRLVTIYRPARAASSTGRFKTSMEVGV